MSEDSATEMQEQPPALEAGPDPTREALWTRVVLPIALPLLAALATGLWAVNLSRTFLAGGETGAIVIVLVMTIAIMTGGTVLSASTRMPSSSRTVLVTIFAAFVITAGFVTFSHGEESSHAAGEPSGYQEPKGEAVATLEVDALPSLKFQAEEFAVPIGIVEIDYVNKGGNHTLLFAESEFNGFKLAVPVGKSSGKVELAAGEYTIYCDVPGHRAAGMEATLIAQ